MMQKIHEFVDEKVEVFGHRCPKERNKTVHGSMFTHMLNVRLDHDLSVAKRLSPDSVHALGITTEEELDQIKDRLKDMGTDVVIGLGKRYREES